MDALARQLGEWLKRDSCHTLFNSQLLRAFPDDGTEPESRNESIKEFAYEHGWSVTVFPAGCTFTKSEQGRPESALPTAPASDVHGNAIRG